MQMTVMSEGLSLNWKYFKMGCEEGLFEAFLTQPPVVIVCHVVKHHLTVIHLRLCDHKKSLGASGLRLSWILGFAFAMNSCSGCGSAVGSNCHQLAWSLAVAQVAKEVCDSRSWLKFKLGHSPLFSSTKLKKMAIAAVKVIWVSSDNKTGYLRDSFCNLFIC